jgi:hypothetical protein
MYFDIIPPTYTILYSTILYLLLQLPETEKRWTKTEFIGKDEYRKDLHVAIEPDAAVLDNQEFKELVLSIN